MDIKKIQENQIIKSYKQLCEILNIKVNNGNAKKSTLKELERYFEYHKEGQKFIIDKKRDKPLPEIKRGGNNTKFSNPLRNNILLYLCNTYGEQIFSNNEKEFEAQAVYVSKKNLLNEMSMVNNDYVDYYNIQGHKRLSTEENIPIDHIDFLYKIVNDKCKSIETALKGLYNERVLRWEKAHKVCEREFVYDEDDYEIEIENEFFEEEDYNKRTHRPATEDEENLIFESQKEALSIMGYKNVQAVYLTNGYERFCELSNKILTRMTKKIEIIERKNNKGEIVKIRKITCLEYAYQCYKIWLIKNIIQNEYENLMQNKLYLDVAESLHSTVEKGVKKESYCFGDKEKVKQFKKELLQSDLQVAIEENRINDINKIKKQLMFLSDDIFNNVQKFIDRLIL